MTTPTIQIPADLDQKIRSLQAKRKDLERQFNSSQPGDVRDRLAVELEKADAELAVLREQEREREEQGDAFNRLNESWHSLHAENLRLNAELEKHQALRMHVLAVLDLLGVKHA